MGSVWVVVSQLDFHGSSPLELELKRAEIYTEEVYSCGTGYHLPGSADLQAGHLGARSRSSLVTQSGRMNDLQQLRQSNHQDIHKN